MMDAVEFIVTRDRMCESFNGFCTGCIFETDVVSMRHIWLRPDYFATCPNCHRLCCTDGDER